MQLLRVVAPLFCLLIAAGCRTKPAPAGPPSAAEPSILRGATNATIVPLPSTNAPMEHPTPTPPAETNLSQATGLETGAPTNAIPPLSARTGDEIVVAGQLFHTGTRVVLWSDTDGYNAYNLHRHFASTNETAAEKPEKRYDKRQGGLSVGELARIRTNGWDLATLQRCVDQFVIHYDVAGTSRQCFYILQDRRFLSVHFLLDLDGTIYQTLDLQERARHASGANDRSVGIEIANIGAYPTNDTSALEQWYDHDTNGQTCVTIPARFGDGGLLTTNFIARPARTDPITNSIHGRPLVQYDFTPEQYVALTHLTAALCRALPQIECDAPRDTNGVVLTEKLPDEQLESYRGLVGHFHLTTNKSDPGPAFDWDKVLNEARRLMDDEKSASVSDPVLQHDSEKNQD